MSVVYFKVKLWLAWRHSSGINQTVLEREIELPFAPYPGLYVEVGDLNGDGFVEFGPISNVVWLDKEQCFIADHMNDIRDEHDAEWQDRISELKEAGWKEL